MKDEGIYKAFNVPNNLIEKVNNNNHIDDQLDAFIYAINMLSKKNDAEFENFCSVSSPPGQKKSPF